MPNKNADEHLLETLDPDDWEAARTLGHKMVDDMIEQMRTVRERPAWQSVSSDSRRALLQELPLKGASLAQVYNEFKQHILPFPTGNQHPRFFGWVMGNGTLTGMFADMLASGMNAHVAGYDQSASIIERQVIEWLAELVGFNKNSSGLLVTGGTMANINGLAVARHEKADFDIREDGLQAKPAPRLRVYGSVQTHNWIYKACELMGLGRNAFRAIPTNDAYEIDIAACRAQIEKDLAAGEKPFCIIGTVGTVNTGAVDDLSALRQLADDFDLWLHIDGAFGSLAIWGPGDHKAINAQKHADSIAFDLHKWGYLPYDVGCVLTQNPNAQNNTFGQNASYLSPTSRGLAVGTTYFADKGVQLSRSFRALKVWMSLKEQGAEKIGRLIQRNIDQAKFLESLIYDFPELELLAPVSLNIVCFRYTDSRYDEAMLDKLNEEILLRLQESGEAIPSHTVLNGKFAIRVCITNYRTQNTDIELLIDQTLRHAKEITAEGLS